MLVSFVISKLISCSGLTKVEKVSTIIYSLVLLIPLFIPRAASEVGGLTGFGSFLNKWYSFGIMLIVLAVHVFMSYKTNKKSSELQMQFFEKNVSKDLFAKITRWNNRNRRCR